MTYPNSIKFAKFYAKLFGGHFIKLLFKFIKPYFFRCILILVFVILDVAGALLIPAVTADMINICLQGGDFHQIIEKGVWMIFISIITGIGALIASFISSDISAKIGRDIRNAVYDKSLLFSDCDFEQYGTGSMITRTLSDVNVIQYTIVMCIQMIIPVPIMCVMGILFSFYINKDMGFLFLIVVIVFMLIAAIIVKKSSFIFEHLQRFFDRMNVVLRENMTGVRVVRAFNKQSNEKNRMKKSFEDYAKTAIYANRLFAILDSFSMFAVNIFIVIILYLGSNYAGQNLIEIGDITALTEYAILILYYIITAQMVMTFLPRAKTCLFRISEILNHSVQIKDTKNLLPIQKMDEKSQVFCFDKVTFRFLDADEDTLQNVSFSLHKGKMNAIIGGTGSGKSTICKLMLRNYDITSGKILLGQYDIRDILQSDLRNHISYVPQKPWLFSGTIADNLRYANPDASKEDMMRALEIAQAHFVNTLPEGLNAKVLQGGMNFSGGQKQRLCIARALVKKADIYIFDDSFSALDFKTDAKLRKAISEQMKDAAVLIVAQRISTIMNSDQILVLDNGKVVGSSTHEFLLENCEVYKDIAKSQMKGGGVYGRK